MWAPDEVRCGLVRVYSLSLTAHQHVPVVAEFNSQTFAVFL